MKKWDDRIRERSDDARTARLGAALWSLVGHKLELRDLSWAIGLFGSDGDRLLFDALREGGAIEEGGTMTPHSLASWFGVFMEEASQVHLVWTMPSRHPMAHILGNSYIEAILNLIYRSETELIMTSPFIQEAGMSCLVNSLVNALDRGVEILLLTLHADNLSSSQSMAIEELRRQACRMGKAFKVYTVEPGSRTLIHAKLVISDRTKVIIGSANLTGPGLEQSFEAGVILGAKQASEAVKAVFGLIDSGLARLVFSTERSNITEVSS